MKKIYLIILLAMLIVPDIYGQLKFGIKAGIVSATSSLDQKITDLPTDVDYDELKIEAQDASVGFQAGLFGRLSVAAIYVQPELMFTSTSSKVKVSEITGTDATSTIRDQEFKKIDFPIMLGWKFGPARVQAGPVGSIVLDQKSAIEAAGEYKEEFNGATWGYQAGFGIDLFKTLTFDAKYEGSLSKLGEGVEIGQRSYSIDNRPSQYILTIGLFF